MASNIVTGIFSIILSIITMISTALGLGPAEAVPAEKVQGFTQKGAEEMRIMSFNIRCANVGIYTWQSRIGIVSETMINSEADSIGVQEATPGWMKALNQNIGHKYAYVGVGRDDGKNEGEYSAVFYLKDKYNLIDSGTFWLSETPDKPSLGWDAACKRVCTWALLENKTTKERYVHMNSHFDHVGTDARSHSVEMIVNKAKEFKDIPVVFTADMNVKEKTENYNQFVNSGVFSDTKYLAPNTMDYLTFHNTKPSAYADWVIDYVMVNSHFEAKTYKVVTEGVGGKYVSDHFPIYADVVLK